MHFFIFIFLLSTAFAKQTCITNNFEELSNLMALAASPKCNNGELIVTPVCHSFSPEGYATLWTVSNDSGSACNDKAKFTQNLQFDNLMEEWQPGITNICGAFWSGSGQLTLNISGSKNQMDLENSPACTPAQHSLALTLCGLYVLPIKLISFEAKAKTESCVEIAFKTASEIDSRGVKIERSSNGSSFSEIADIPSSHPSGGSYGHKDCEAKSQETYFYRLKQIDMDGRETFSEIKKVKLSPEPKIYPNPAKDKLNIGFSTKGKEFVNVRIVNVLGQVVVNKKMPLESNAEGIKIDVNPYASGMYFLEVRDPDNNPIIKGSKGKFIIAR